jgi:hypothetical protein
MSTFPVPRLKLLNEDMGGRSSSLSQGHTKPMTQVRCDLTTTWQRATRILVLLSDRVKLEMFEWCERLQLLLDESSSTSVSVSRDQRLACQDEHEG